MFPVYFSPLYPFLTIQSYPSILSPTATGVYVWGFKFPDPYKPSGLGRFIPYYVGMADGTSILTRLKCHYNFNQSYNVFKPQYLPTYFNHLQPDLTVQKKMSPLEYKCYNEWFAYLNTGNEASGELGNNGDAFDQLRTKRITDKDVNPAIQNYQDNFYACWIVLPVSTNGKNPMINSLESHINYHFPHSPIGEPNAKDDPSFQINEIALGKDKFLNAKGWQDYLAYFNLINQLKRFI